MIGKTHRLTLYNTLGVTIPASDFTLKIVKRNVVSNQTQEELWTYANAAELESGSSVALTGTKTALGTSDIDIAGLYIEMEGVATLVAPALVNGSFSLYYEVSPDNGTTWCDLGRGRLVLTDTISVSGTIKYALKISG